jgi:hypothetical protein
MSPANLVTRTSVLVTLAAAVSLAVVLPAATLQDAAADGARAATASKTDLVSRQVGTWDVSAAFTGMPPDQGTSVVRMVGGHWAVEDYKGTFGG